MNCKCCKRYTFRLKRLKFEKQRAKVINVSLASNMAGQDPEAWVIIVGFHLKTLSQPMCVGAEIPISGHFLCHRNSDLTKLKGKAYSSVDFVYLSNVLKVFSSKGLSEENLA